MQLLEIRQSHLGTDGGVQLVRELVEDLSARGVAFSLGET